MEKQPTLSLGMDMAYFEGVFANMFIVSSSGQEARLDCVYVDKVGTNPETGETPAKIVARVNMTTDSLVELRNALDEHIAKNLSGVQKDAE